MSGAKIKINDNGPYVVTNSFELVDATGAIFETKKVISLCRCGYSDNKPFCDGSHKKANFVSEPRVGS